MRVLFLESGTIWAHTLPNGFCDAGHDVMISGPLTEENIPKMVSQFKPDLAISIGWGLDHTPEKQEWIGKHVHKAGVPLVYWAIEDPAFTETFTVPLIKRMQPDFVFTLCPEKVDYYQRKRIKAAYMDFGYHPSIHCPIKSEEGYRCSIAVVANAYPDVLAQYPSHFRHSALQNLVLPLVKENVRVDFWGNDWDQMQPYMGTDIPKEWIHGHHSYLKANIIYNSADIVIGLQNYPHIVTQRTYEILASGGFLLTLNTNGVKKLFSHEKDLVVSSSPQETLKLVNYYLEHPEKRKKISQQGKSTVSGHSYRNRADYMIDVLIHFEILSHDKKYTNASGGKITHFLPIHEENQYLMYRVNKGDTLYRISKKFNVKIDEIMKLNDLTSDMIFVEQPLKIRRENSTVHDFPHERKEIDDIGNSYG